MYPNHTQEKFFNQSFGCCRFLYNSILSTYNEYKQYLYQYLPINQAMKMIPKYKQQYPWLKVTDSYALQNTVKILYQNINQFFQKNAKFPKFVKKKNRQTYHTQNSDNIIRFNEDHIHLPKIGWIKCKISRHINGKILNATIIKEASGKYFVCVTCELPKNIKFLRTDNKQIGLDIGIQHFCTTSNGTVIKAPEPLKKYQKKLSRFHRAFTRRNKNSSNREKIRLQMAKLHEKIKNIRRDFLHKLTTQLVRENQTIAVETLDVCEMGKGNKIRHKLNDLSIGRFFTFLKYKSLLFDVNLIFVDKYFASSQICSHCGYRNSLLKDLTIRNWTCPKCHTKHNRDINAANNILSEALKIA